MSKYFNFMVLFLALEVLAIEAPQSRAVIESPDRTVLSSEIGGKIVSMSKSNGDYFKKGSTLVKIDCNIYRAERDKIRVKRDLAKIKLNKNLKLQSFNSVGKFDVQISKLELKEQELDYKIANINVRRCDIKAPYNGRIVQKLANKYQNIKPQEELLEIISSDSLEIKTVVPALWLQWLKIGQKIKVKIDELDLELESKVLQIDSVVDPKSQTINIRAKINNSSKNTKNKNIIAGMSATVFFIMSDSK